MHANYTCLSKPVNRPTLNYNTKINAKINTKVCYAARQNEHKSRKIKKLGIYCFLCSIQAEDFAFKIFTQCFMVFLNDFLRRHVLTNSY